MKKRTKIIILSLMIVLLGVTGYLNIVLNNSISPSTPTTTTNASVFSTYRTNREYSRDQQLLYYDAIIESSASSAESIALAESAKLELIGQIQKELVAEGLIKATGFEDCVISVSDSGNINVVVKSGPEISEQSRIAITNIIKEQFNVKAKNLIIIPSE